MKEIMDTVRRAVQAWRNTYPLSDETEKEINVMLKTVRESLMKQVPMKPTDNDTEYNCSRCNTHVVVNDGYCWGCGQAIDWTEVKE